MGLFNKKEKKITLEDIIDFMDNGTKISDKQLDEFMKNASDDTIKKTNEINNERINLRQANKNKS